MTISKISTTHPISYIKKLIELVQATDITSISIGELKIERAPGFEPMPGPRLTHEISEITQDFESLPTSISELNHQLFAEGALD